VTFDDVPMSAYRNALPILRQHGVKATFYVAMGMGKGFLGSEQIADIHNQGHEIACHTYSHYLLSTGDCDGLGADARNNKSELAQLLGEGDRNFSFPYGEMSWAAKNELQCSYQSLRSNRPGINYGSTDLNCLKAYSLRNSTPKYISELLDRAEKKNGWLILYTHGVDTQPGAHGIPPAALGWILAECGRRQIQVLPVKQALEIGIARKLPPTTISASTVASPTPNMPLMASGA
jgi:peptidoglycan/xylan/chitin deacetylase (PgdA/CDA1 family)